MAAPTTSKVVSSTIPARIDRLPWSSFHTRMVTALGACWILDGFEIAVVSNLGQQLAQPNRLGLSSVVNGFLGGLGPSLGTIYLLGEVVGALVFGQLSDRLGRRRLFVWTLAVYFIGSALTATVIGNSIGSIVFLYLTRFIAGAGIGGEYAAINSTIDELVPARYRGQVDIAVNGTYWAGAAIAGAIQIPLLSGAIDPNWDWRIALLIGPTLAILIWFLRRNLPESPRWQIMRGHTDEAEKSITHIEHEVDPTGQRLPDIDRCRAIDIKPVPHVGYLMMLRLLFRAFPDRCLLGATMLITQSFMYNAIYFNYAGVLVSYFHVAAKDTASYAIPFAIGNLIGPLLLGWLFDKIGRRKMIFRTYVMSGLLLIVSAVGFMTGGFTAVTQTMAWCVIFSFASAGASSAYLTVSEIFPMEIRAKAVAVFFALAQTAGSLGPLFYGHLINQDNPDRASLFVGFLVGALVMIFGGVVARILAVDAERKSLEDVATPLSVAEARKERGVAK